MNFNQIQVGDPNDCPPFTTTYASGYDNFSEMENYDYGWVCPRCGSVNAPWVRQCDCSNKWEITCNNDAAVTIGSSDYWDKSDKTWTNVLKNVSNIIEI